MPTATKQLTLTIRPKLNHKRVVIELDADRFERLAANLGFFHPEFLKSLDRAEREITAGKTKRLKNLRVLRRLL